MEPGNEQHILPAKSAPLQQPNISTPESSEVASPGVSFVRNARRYQACDSCRHLKVRCESDQMLSGRCKRCAKAGRACHVKPPQPKSGRKRGSTAAEVKKKIKEINSKLEKQPSLDTHRPAALPEKDPVLGKLGVIDWYRNTPEQVPERKILHPTSMIY
jgi:hypothetical protein